MKVSFCFIAFVLLISSLYMSIMKKDDQIFHSFNNLLDNHQKKKYQSIIFERSLIYGIGMLLGL